MLKIQTIQYIDLANTFLYVRASVTAADGTDLEEDVEIAPECNFLHTMWSQIDVYEGLLSHSPITTTLTVPILKICLVLVKTQNHHNFLLSCGIGIQLVNLIQEAIPTRLRYTQSTGCTKPPN